MPICPKCNQEYADELFKCPCCKEQEPVKLAENEARFTFDVVCTFIAITILVLTIFSVVMFLFGNFLISLSILFVGGLISLFVYGLGRIVCILNQQKESLKVIEALLLQKQNNNTEKK